MSDVFQEVDEEVRQDQLKMLWDRWGLIFVVSIISIVLAWTGWVLWRNSVEAAREAESAAFEAAVLEPAGSGLAALEALAATAESGYAAIAAFHKAGLLLEQGRPEEAVGAYDGIASQSTANARLQGMASLLAAMVLSDMGAADEARARLQPLAVEGSDWVLSARELLGLLDFRAGDLDAAESAFNILRTNRRTPGAMRQRSQEMLELIDSRRALATAAPVAPPATPNEEEDGS